MCLASAIAAERRTARRRRHCWVMLEVLSTLPASGLALRHYGIRELSVKGDKWRMH